MKTERVLAVAASILGANLLLGGGSGKEVASQVREPRARIEPVREGASEPPGGQSTSPHNQEVRADQDAGTDTSVRVSHAPGLARGAQVYRTGNTITTIAGAPLAFGNSPVESAAAFIRDHGALLGIGFDDLAEGSLAGDNAHTRGLMPVRDEQGKWTGEYKFTLVSYLQVRDGIPVYRGNVRLLVRNEVGCPVVLVRSGLRTLRGFHPDVGVLEAPNIAGALDAARRWYPGIDGFSDPQLMIFAGDDVSRPRPPTLAAIFEGWNGAPFDAGRERYRVVADAATGSVLFSESLIEHVDVIGTVNGLATTGWATAECNTEAQTAMPYARVSIPGSGPVYAEANGSFTIPYAGTSEVQVTGSLQGKYFNVYTPSSLEPTIPVTVTPPGPASIVFNALDNNQTRRAAANAYREANVARDFLLAHAPGYPIIPDETSFRVNVNVAGTCNAFYDPDSPPSINFNNISPGCSNSAFSSIVQHEYGHHIVHSGGSGGAEYGEGMADCVSLLISDQPLFGAGWTAGCNVGTRNADNECVYDADDCSSCGVEKHLCGTLLSGCVWSLRNNLEASDPTGYKQVLADLVLNSIPLHDGTSINSQIYTDFVTLDGGASGDHFCEIARAFQAHGMATAGAELTFTYSHGRPHLIPPDGEVLGTVQVGSLCSAPESGTGTLYVDAENDGTYAAYPMSEVSANTYEPEFPSIPCGALVRWYVAAETTFSTTETDPPGAPAAYHTAYAGLNSWVAFNDDFESDQGWVATAASSIVTGFWERGVPVDPYGAAPGSDYDGSARCFVTDNDYGSSVGSYDVDASDPDTGHVYLMSPSMNAAGGDEAFISYARWFDNSGAGAGFLPWDDLFVIHVSDDDGATWTTLEVVGPVAGARGRWRYRTVGLSQFVNLTEELKICFDASDLDDGSVIEAGVDSVRLEVVSCFCPADYDRSGFVNGDDFDAFVAAFEVGYPSADFNHNGFVDGDDFDGFMEVFETGC